MAITTFRWWPIVGFLILFGAFGHLGLGFGCRQDPDIDTDPSIPPESPSEPQTLTVPVATSSFPSAALAFLAVVGGLVAMARIRRGDGS